MIFGISVDGGGERDVSITISSLPPSESGPPGSGRGRASAFPARSVTAPPLSDRAPVPV